MARPKNSYDDHDAEHGHMLQLMEKLNGVLELQEAVNKKQLEVYRKHSDQLLKISLCVSYIFGVLSTVGAQYLLK